MKFFGVILVIVGIACADPIPEGRIVGGQEGDIKDFPYQLSLRINGRHNCGASVIAPRWALTAAHCLEKIEPWQLTLLGGSTDYQTGGVVFEASDLLMHPDYNSRTSNYDVGLIRIKRDFSGENIKRINLPEAGELVVPGKIATVSGWGYTSDSVHVVSQKLRFVNIPIIEQETCNQALKNYGGVRGMMFCAGSPGLDTCNGDSGGPIILNNKQIGVVSGGLVCGENPGVYSRLANANIRAWIRNMAKV